MLYGHELLGAAKYEKSAIENLPRGRCGKLFLKEFGPGQTVFRRWAEKKVHPLVAGQGLWRGNHDYSGDRILSEGLKELEKIIPIAQANASQQFQFSIYCEHKLKTSALEKIFTKQWALVKDVLNITLVNNPMSGGDLLKAGAFGIPSGRLLNETHGTWNPNLNGFAPYMWACDGLPAQDCDIQLFKDRHIHALVQWLWMQQYNCKMKVDETTPIAQRKVKPVKKQIISLDYLIPSKGEPKFDQNSIFKTHADQHSPVPAPREQKPVIITPVNGTRLEFLDKNKKVIHTADRQGNYTDGRPLYRSTIWGFEIQDRAVKSSGSPIVTVRAVNGSNRKRLGTVNPAFRENSYRLKSAVKYFDVVKVGRHAVTLVASKDEELLDLDFTVALDWV